MAMEVGTSPTALSQLQSVQKVMAMPTVGAAVGQVGAFYTKVKGAHSLLEWALSTAEASVSLAAATAAPYVASPLAAGDAKMAAVIDELGRRVPIVNEQPKVIVETTKQAVIAKISPHVNKVFVARAAAEQRVHSLKELSWAKANALLSTAYGQRALHGVDAGACYAMKLLDQYLPPVEPQPDHTGQSLPYTTCDIVEAERDPALHTVQTVGRLSAVAARRVWANLAARVNHLRANGVELDVRRYITALLAAVHLATVTSEQQQQERDTDTEQPRPAHPAPTTHAHPAPTSHTAPTSPTSPTTATKLKSTPEAKSTKPEDSEL
ncbi:PREDICTED: lipid storage droplets surface-binding protein 2 isoform X1 [Papilio xuthus]|uniref:Lipid storage droplets surface-binding protein 2 isoform X1 n=1 Tax=Papilio xuthus TaxID=66420 RepID=A0AAJ6Z945_PAPXU|nr:PREDICTED: lipid storage droplets surface-binding protein 2 isoform X1 [Papilio xuthus]